MAFDLVGESPENYHGKWIRFNIWTWHRIWRGLQEIAPELTKDTILWYTNSGELVDSKKSVAMAELIEKIGSAGFAKIAAPKHPHDPMLNIGDRTIEAHIEFETRELILFLKHCGGFRID